MPSNCVGSLPPGSLFEEEPSILFNLCSISEHEWVVLSIILASALNFLSSEYNYIASIL